MNKIIHILGCWSLVIIVVSLLILITNNIYVGVGYFGLGIYYCLRESEEKEVQK